MDVTEHAKPPRVLFLPFRMGHQFGVPFHRSLQTEIVMACLNLLGKASDTWIMEHFGKTWAEARREGKQFESIDSAN